MTSNRSRRRVPVQIFLVHQAKISRHRRCHSTTAQVQQQDNASLMKADACELHRCRPSSHWHSAQRLFQTAAVDRIPAVQLFLDSIGWPLSRYHRCYYRAGTRKTCPSLLWCTLALPDSEFNCGAGPRGGSAADCANVKIKTQNSEPRHVSHNMQARGHGVGRIDQMNVQVTALHAQAKDYLNAYASFAIYLRFTH